jgi:hypothetical protein
LKDIVIRHYIFEQVHCEPTRQTGETLRKLCAQMAPKLAKLEVKLVLQEAVVENPDPGNIRMMNRVTFSCPEEEMPEQDLDEILGLQVTHEPCRTCSDEAGFPVACRTVMVEEQGYQALPSGLIADALLRFSFSVLAGGQTCDTHSCGGCCEGCHGGH